MNEAFKIMTPKEKAKNLVNNFTVVGLQQRNEGIACALICVNEILASNPHSNPFNTDVYSTMDYWNEVKKEIEKI